MNKLLILLIVLTFQFSCTAQDKKSSWSFTSNNTFEYFSGNVNKFDAMTSNEIEHDDSIYEFSLNYQFLYGEQSNTKYLLEHMASVYYDYRPHKRLSPWINATFLQNNYKGFVMRLNAAAGVKYRFINTQSHDWSISGGLLFDHANYAKPTESSTPQRNTENILRISIRPKIKIKINESAQLKHVTYYQPEIKNFGNYIAWSQTEFSVKVIKHISASMMYYYFYNSHPAYATISKSDQRILFGVKVEI